MTNLTEAQLWAIFIILWLLVVAIAGGIAQWLHNRRIDRERRRAYIEYIEKENARLRRTNAFYRVQMEDSHVQV